MTEPNNDGRVAQRFQVTWNDAGRDAVLPADPAFPAGIEVDISESAARCCTARLDYPAPRCGAWLIECQICGATAAVTAAGRADDPVSVKLPCSTLGSAFGARAPEPEPERKPERRTWPEKAVAGQRSLI